MPSQSASAAPSEFEVEDVSKKSDDEESGSKAMYGVERTHTR